MIIMPRRHSLKLSCATALALVLMFGASSKAFAACSTPAGNAGDIVYSATSNTMAYCNGTFWIAMGSNSDVSYGTLTTNDICTATSSTAISCATTTTGTGNVVMSSSPTLTGTVAGANATWSGQVAIGTATQNGALNVNGTVTATGFAGSGASLTGIGIAGLGGIIGTPSSSTYLRGDGTWATASSGTTTGTGAANYMAMWAGTSSLSSSAIYQNGSNIGIGTTTASTALQVNGTVTATTFSGSGASLTGIGTSSLGGITGTASSTTFLTGNGTWTAALTGLPALSSGNIWVGNVSNAATAVSPSGDVTIGNTGVTAVGKIAGVSVGTPTGTGNVVMSASPTLTGTITAATANFSGPVSYLFGTDYATTGSQSDVALGSASAIRYNGSGVATFYGIVAGTNGQIVNLHNASSAVLTLSNQSGSEATAANKIITGTGADLAVAANSSVTIQYDATAARWRVIGGSGGATPAGATGQVQYNSGSNSLAAGNNFTFLSATNELVIGTGAATPVATTGTVAGPTFNVIPQAVSVTPAAATGGLTFNTAATGQMAYYSGASAISGTSNLYVSGSNIGIGTSSATNLLSLSGQGAQVFWMEREYTAATAGNSLTVQAGGAVSGGSNLAGGNLILSSGTSTGTGTSQIQFKTFPAGGSGTTDGTATTDMTITGAGNVGIGTASPATALQVNGTITATNAIITGGAPQVTVYTSSSGTYTTPTNALYLVVEMVGGGGGGGGGGTTGGGTGGTGGSTTFGSSFLTSNGGGGGPPAASGAVAGGSVSGCDMNITGGPGSVAPGSGQGAISYDYGGNGGVSYFGGGGYGGWPGTGGAAGQAYGSGAGGGGGPTGSAAEGGGGGGAGGYCRKLISSPSASYAYAVGGGGGGGSAATSGFAGGTGASGLISVTAYFR